MLNPSFYFRKESKVIYNLKLILFGNVGEANILVYIYTHGNTKAI